MIKVNEEFYIDSDNYGYTVYRKMVSKETEKEYFTTIAYPSNIERCIQTIIRFKQREKCKEDLSLHEYLNECRKINDEMKEILNKIKGMVNDDE